MSVAGVTGVRTIGWLRSRFSTTLSIGGFLSLVSLLFAFRLTEAEGGTLSAVEVWATCAAQVLPFLAAALGMDVWSDERRSGRMAVLLATAVRERDLALGKFAGVFFDVAAVTLLSFAVSLLSLWFVSPAALAGIGVLSVLLSFFALAVQAALWSAIAVAASAFFDQAAASFCTAIGLSFVLPRGLWFGLMSWSAADRASFGAMPLDAHVLDMSAGILSGEVLCGYLACSLVALFVSSKAVASTRLLGRGAVRLRISTAFAVFLSLVAAALTTLLASRVGFVIDLPVSDASVTLSPRTRSILSETSGEVTATAMLSRKDPRFRSLSRFLRLLKRQSEALGGARFILRYVDPRWDVGLAERLVGRGARNCGLVFERGHRLVSLGLDEAGSERACATALRRLTVVPARRNVYWTVGHGERNFEEYGPFGMSDIARDIAREGFLNRKIDLAAAARIPGDCAVIVVAGARDAFSRQELGRLDAYLKEGGRLLVMFGSQTGGGVAPLLPSWGISVGTEPLPPAASTESGSNVIVSDFPDNPVSSRLAGSRIVLEKPVVFSPSAAAEILPGVDRIQYLPIAVAGGRTVAATIERGTGSGADLAIRPTRAIVVGDVSFVANGPMAQRANANRDFLLNCISYLSGSGTVGAQGVESGVFASGLDRRGRLAVVFWSVIVLPALITLVFLFNLLRRRVRA